MKPGASVVLAVSGGVDSMVMLHLFAEMSSEWNLRLAVAHVNHQLRGEESMGDEAFVEKSAKSLHIPFYTTRIDTLAYAGANHVSKQEAARQLRYDFLEQVRLRTKSDCVATAHQADDNAETVLMNALRGTGIRGLAGIPIRRDPGNIIRPILFARRREIEEYAKGHQIAFRSDSSNESVKYRRNYLRRNVIPLLESSGKSDFVTSLNRLSQLMRQLDRLLSAEVQQTLGTILSQHEDGGYSLNIAELRSKPQYLQEGIVLEVLRKLGAEVESGKVLKVFELCNLTTGSQLQLSKSLHVYRDRDRLAFVQPREEAPLNQAVSLGQSYTLPYFRFSLSMPIPRPPSLGSCRDIEFVDAGKLGERLVLRSWQEGDWFIPLGMKSRKKISNFYVDEKIPLAVKPRVPIFESDGTIVWICGRRLDERFKVTDQTRHVVRLEFSSTLSFHQKRILE